MNIRENIWRWGEGSKANSSGIQAGYGAAIELRGFREQEERKRNSGLAHHQSKHTGWPHCEEGQYFFCCKRLPFRIIRRLHFRK
jgi:hypothetical protein